VRQRVNPIAGVYVRASGVCILRTAISEREQRIRAVAAHIESIACGTMQRAIGNT